jgi:hypothetical protein
MVLVTERAVEILTDWPPTEIVTVGPFFNGE